jgi:hypothetical protein
LAELKKKKQEAVAHVLAALNLELAVPQDAVGPLPLFPQIMAQLMLANERVQCQAWIVKLIGNSWHAELNGQSFMVYAVSQDLAYEYVKTMSMAFRPSIPVPSSASFAWSVAPREQQPLAPVYPGVQFVVG